jgi:centrosomal protein CEP104
VLELAVERAQASLRRSDLALLDAFMPQIVERLGNNTGRVRLASAQLLVHLASQKNIGPLFVSSFALRAKRAGKTLLWRQLLGRLALIAVLIKEFGTRDEYGLGLDQVMEFVASNNALAHPNAEVREACKDLFMQAYVHVGKAVLPYLKDLRPKQMEEYQTGFQAIDDGNGAPQAGAAAAASTASLGGDEPKEAKPSKAKGSAAKGDKPAGAAATAAASAAAAEKAAAAAEKAAAAAEKAAAAGGANSARDSARDSQPRPSSRSAVAAAAVAQPSPPSPVIVNVNVVQQQQGHALGAEEEEEAEGEVEAFTCQFCSRKDPTLTEDALDMHYWKECPMLTSCAQCEQVIEVALLNEHLLKECENKDNHRQCLRCNEAIAAQFFEQHSQRASCLPAKPVSKANRCPLCHKDCKAGVQGWKQHILAGQGCPKNPRTAHLR